MNTALQHDGDHAPAQQQKSQQKALRFVTNYGAPHPKRYIPTLNILTLMRG